MHGECFGPLAPICRVTSLDEAIALANDSELGLGANIYTNDLAEAFRAVNEIETGIVWVNTPLNDNDAVPFGGRKFTGSGRELGAEGLEQFRRSKMVMISPTAEADPEWFPYPDGDAFPAARYGARVRIPPRTTRSRHRAVRLDMVPRRPDVDDSLHSLRTLSEGGK
jgi:betaine-aldehyde dehydrogenase